MRHLDINEKFQDLEKSFKMNYLECSLVELITPNELSKVKKSDGLFSNRVHFIDSDVVEVMSSFDNPAVLVFCSSKTPGGGFLRGSIAQEESISLYTSWYFQAKRVNGFYLNRGDSAVNTDNIIYVDKGHILKDKYHNDIIAKPISFIGSTAVNLRGLADQGIDVKNFNYTEIMSHRIENVLKVAEIKGKKTLILGAWGCGVFQLDPHIIAQIFADKIKENIFTGSIIFTIPDHIHLNIFKDKIIDTL